MISSSLHSMGCNMKFLPSLDLKYHKFFAIRYLYRFYGEFRLFILLRLNFRNVEFENCILNTEILSWSIFGINKQVRINIIVHSLSFTKSALLSSIVFKLQSLNVCKYIAVSNAVAEALKNSGVKKNVVMVYNGVDLNYFSTTTSRSEKNVIQLLVVIHPVRHKGAHFLIETLSRLKDKGLDFMCNVAGWRSSSCDKNYIRLIESEITARGLGTYINFYEKHVDMYNVYMSADILIHPSYSESFGYVIAEAMASSLPVVAFEVGGIPELVIHGETGFLIEPYNLELMTLSVVTLIKDLNLRRKLGIQGRNRVEENFNSDTNSLKLLTELNLI